MFSKYGSIQVGSRQINSIMLAVEVDVRDKLSVKKFMEDIMNKHQKVDILVNPGYPFEDIIWNHKIHEGSNKEFEKIVNVDLLMHIRLCRAVLPVMMQASPAKPQSNNIIIGRSVGGLIINIISTSSIFDHSGDFPYSIANLDT